MRKNVRGGIDISIKWGTLELALKVRGLTAFFRTFFGRDDGDLP